MFVVRDNRSCMRNNRSEINYSLGNKSLVVSITNLADLKQGNRVRAIAFSLKANGKECNKTVNYNVANLRHKANNGWIQEQT